MFRFDLRSDTVTQPTEAMRRVMAQAEVGDDCYADDPNVIALESEVADRLGKEAALFVPSGTMANQIALRLHAQPGEAVTCVPGAHVRIHENGSAAALAGVQLMALGTRDYYGRAELEALLDEEPIGWPRVGCVWLENTAGDAGGTLIPRAAFEGVAALARDAGRPVHLDGARLWNASVEEQRAPQDYAAHADTVMVCLSKGLGAPVGSVLAGTHELISRARPLKHAYGGGFRQAGILAAAGRYALVHHLDGLASDHAHAKRVAEAIADLRCWSVATPQTNMVLARVADDVPSAESLCAPLRAAGVHCYPNRAREVRLVFHLGIRDTDIEPLIQAIRGALA